MNTTQRQHDSALTATPLAREVALLWLIRQGQSVVVHGGVTVGRTSDADVVVADPLMSGRHARIEEQGGVWRLVDLGSRNGIFVDGVLLPPGATAPLGDDTVLRLGDTLAVFSVSAEDSGPEADVTSFPGQSLVAARVRRRIHRLAESGGHVLIFGETGTGKERVARTLGERGRELVPQNCAELSRELARSELFGHVRGAFSGAITNRPGLVERAHEGTLFLDELAELAGDVQAELLRFLEDGQYRPIGASDLRTSSARVIAATNRDLDVAVRDGAFRRDLLARLRTSNTPLELPPLRERREDLLAWSRYFLEEIDPAVPEEPWTPGALECLLIYPWPENLRELRGACRAAREASPRWPLDSVALPARIQEHRRQRRSSPRPDGVVANPTRAEIEAVLAQCAGRMRQAAELLHVDRTRLYRLCEKHAIDIEQFRGG